MHKYQHRRHNKNLLMAHIFFAAKYRKPILAGSVREDVMQSIYDTANDTTGTLKRWKQIKTIFIF